MTKALFHLRQLRLLLLVLLCALFSLPLNAQEAYVVQSTDLKTLFFCYDNHRESRSGKTWGIDEMSYNSIPVWAGKEEHPNNVVTKIVFDASFKDFRPTTTRSWFYYLSELTTIEGLENLNTSAVTNMRYMFEGCSSLKELNVSNFSTYIVKGMSRMFANCSSLKTILNTSTWQCEESQDMFKGCTQLKGAVKGAVKYDESRVDVTMANPTTGYFTDPNRKEAYVLQSEDQHTLTFYLDNNRRLRSGKTWYIDELSGSSKPIWAGTDESPNNVVTKVVFDASFKYFIPRTTNSWFYNLKALTTIEGLENLNTSSVTDMRNMFSDCSSLKELNVSNLNTSSVKDMSAMFANCSGLKTILNTNTWRCEKSKDMFKGCTQLRGSVKGAVKYDESKVNVTMANPTTGYFTDTREAYVLQSEDQHTLTFYYDNNRKLRSGKTWDIDEKSSSSKPVWAGILHSHNKVVTKVVFDASFKDFRPTTTEGWFYNLSALTTIERIENLNTSAVMDMSEMFEGCWSLTSLNVSNFNTSKVTDMRDMFGDCSSLTELNISNFNTSAVTNMRDMFAGCTSLTELNVSNFNTSAVTDMGRMFFRCFGLTSLNLSNFNTSKVTDMGRMFEGCSGLTSLNLSNFSTSAVTDMDCMFYGCSGLTKLNVSNFNTSKVTDMWGMFKNCSSLKELNVSNFNTSAVKNMSWMFYNCSGLKELNVSNFNTSKVWDMNWMFSGCSSLKTILNPNTWRCERSQDMFKGCTQLNGAVKYDESKLDVTMANPTTGYFADPNRKIEAYVLQSEDQHTLTFYYDNNRKLRSGKTWDIDEKSSSSKPAWAGTNEHPNNVFTKVVFDASFKDFRPTTTNSWFYNLKALTTIEGLENLNTSAVTNMSDMFSGCSSLKTIFNTVTWRCEQSQDMFKGCTQLNGAVKYDESKLDVTMANPTTGYFTDPNRKLEAYVLQSEYQHTLTFYYDNNRKLRSGKTWDIDQKSSSSKPAWAGTYSTSNKAVTKVVFDTSFKDFRPTTTEGWFYHLSELTTIEGLENLNTSAVTDMNTMFSGCSSLMSLNLSNFNTSAVTNMSEMFYGCSGLKELNVSNFNTSAVTDMSAMFFRCSSLKELNVSNFNISAVKDMSGMFSGCSGLKTILNLNTWRCERSQDMFKGCTQLKGAVKYDGSKVNVTMANPTTGYFTDPNRKLEAYVLQSKDQHTLTFYYDYNRKLHSGKTWDIDEKSSSSKPTWAGTDYTSNKAVTKVVFDASFKDFSPTTTEGWFYHLSELTTIEGLENLNTSEVTNMSSMFSGCSSLTELNLSNFNTSKVTSMSSMFSNCSGLTSLNLSNFNTSAVTNMSSMFSGCSGLTSLNLSNFNTSKVWNMDSMFSGCSVLKTILNPNTWRCEQSQDMFKGCTQLNGAVEYDASKVNVWMANPTTGYFTDPNRKLEAYVLQSENQHTLTFYYDNNRKLHSGKTWDIDQKSSSSTPAWAGTNEHPNNVFTKVVFDASFKDFRPTTTNSWFYNLKALTTIEGLENLNTSAVTDMSVMFWGCSRLTSLNLSNFNTSKVTNMRGMFHGCSRLLELNVSNFNTSKVTNMEGMFSNCSGLKIILNTNTWRCENSQDMFKGCTQLKGTVKYDDKKLDATMANPTTGYFTDPNRKVEAYVLQSEDQHTLTFYYDNNRKLRSGKTWDIDEKSSSSKPAWAGTNEHPNNVFTKVVFDASFKDFRPTTTNSWFYNLKALTTIEGLENLNTSAVTDMSVMFWGCSRLTSLNLSNFNTSKVTNMRGMFHGCSRLLELNVSNFNTSKVTNMSEIFEGCSGLKELNISNFNTSAVTKMQRMFFGCSSLTELNVSHFNTSAVTNMKGMFGSCSSLKELNVSNFNTSAVTDMEGMFYGCSRLTELNVSNFNTSGVTNMEGMFFGCSSLTFLNLSNFNTSAVTYMIRMFDGCSSLKTIFNTNTWRCEESQDMFKGCTQLKGAVKYDASKLDATMANPETGYFSRKLPTAIGRVVFDDNNATQIYNLQGKRVNGNQRHLPAGFYIVNGKKVYLNEKP